MPQPRVNVQGRAYTSIRQELYQKYAGKDLSKRDFMRLDSKGAYSKGSIDRFWKGSDTTRSQKYADYADAIKTSINQEFSKMTVGGQPLGDAVMARMGDPNRLKFSDFAKIDVMLSQVLREAANKDGVSADAKDEIWDVADMLLEANRGDHKKLSGDARWQANRRHAALAAWKDRKTAHHRMRRGVERDMVALDPGKYRDNPALRQADAKAFMIRAGVGPQDRFSMENVRRLALRFQNEAESPPQNILNLSHQLAIDAKARFVTPGVARGNTALAEQATKLQGTNPASSFAKGLHKLANDVNDIVRKSETHVQAFRLNGAFHGIMSDQEKSDLFNAVRDNAFQMRRVADQLPASLNEAKAHMLSGTGNLAEAQAVYKEMPPEEQKAFDNEARTMMNVRQTLLRQVASYHDLALTMVPPEKRGPEERPFFFDRTETDVRVASAANRASRLEGVQPGELAQRTPSAVEIGISGAGRSVVFDTNQLIDTYNIVKGQVTNALNRYQTSGRDEHLEELTQALDVASSMNDRLSQHMAGLHRLMRVRMPGVKMQHQLKPNQQISTHSNIRFEYGKLGQERHVIQDLKLLASHEFERRVLSQVQGDVGDVGANPAVMADVVHGAPAPRVPPQVQQQQPQPPQNDGMIPQGQGPVVDINMELPPAPAQPSEFGVTAGDDDFSVVGDEDIIEDEEWPLDGDETAGRMDDRAPQNAAAGNPVVVPNMQYQDGDLPPPPEDPKEFFDTNADDPSGEDDDASFDGNQTQGKSGDAITKNMPHTLKGMPPAPKAGQFEEKAPVAYAETDDGADGIYAGIGYTAGEDENTPGDFDPAKAIYEMRRNAPPEIFAPKATQGQTPGFDVLDHVADVHDELDDIHNAPVKHKAPVKVRRDGQETFTDEFLVVDKSGPKNKGGLENKGGYQMQFDGDVETAYEHINQQISDAIDQEIYQQIKINEAREQGAVPDEANNEEDEYFDTGQDGYVDTGGYQGQRAENPRIVAVPGVVIDAPASDKEEGAEQVETIRTPDGDEELNDGLANETRFIETPDGDDMVIADDEDFGDTPNIQKRDRDLEQILADEAEWMEDEDRDDDLDNPVNFAAPGGDNEFDVDDDGEFLIDGDDDITGDDDEIAAANQPNIDAGDDDIPNVKELGIDDLRTAGGDVAEDLLDDDPGDMDLEAVIGDLNPEDEGILEEFNETAGRDPQAVLDEQDAEDEQIDFVENIAETMGPDEDGIYMDLERPLVNDQNAEDEDEDDILDGVETLNAPHAANANKRAVQSEPMPNLDNDMEVLGDDEEVTPGQYANDDDIPDNAEPLVEPDAPKAFDVAEQSVQIEAGLDEEDPDAVLAGDDDLDAIMETMGQNANFGVNADNIDPMAGYENDFLDEDRQALSSIDQRLGSYEVQLTILDDFNDIDLSDVRTALQQAGSGAFVDTDKLSADLELAQSFVQDRLAGLIAERNTTQELQAAMQNDSSNVDPDFADDPSGAEMDNLNGRITVLQNTAQDLAEAIAIVPADDETLGDPDVEDDLAELNAALENETDTIQ